ncbi:hypothetical protein [Streptomyces olivaceus]|uniref:hypothetical protein n=1 Tax=Streptomyces olivaceus TaxID=47716 RepID=UPI0004CACDB8|nr:hypothetical protein [Streptomyces olivaceus]
MPGSAESWSFASSGTGTRTSLLASVSSAAVSSVFSASVSNARPAGVAGWWSFAGVSMAYSLVAAVVGPRGRAARGRSSLAYPIDHGAIMFDSGADALR